MRLRPKLNSAFNIKPSASEAEILAVLRKSHEHTLNQKRELNSPSVDGLSHALRHGESSVRAFEQVGREAVASFGRQSKRRVKNGEAYRTFQLEWGLAGCEAHQPTLEHTAFIMGASITLEAGMAAALFYGDGHFDIPAAATIGLTFAALNATTSLTTGFLGLRNLRYPAHGLVKYAARGFAAVGSMAGVSLIGALGFTAARFRVTGKPEGIWDFSEISVLGTFNDYFGFALVVIAGVAGTVGLWKGVTGFSDPVPGYLQRKLDATEVVDREAEAERDRLLDECDERMEVAEDDLEGAKDEFEKDAEVYVEKFNGCCATITAHNNLVDEGLEAAQRLALKQGEDIKFIEVKERARAPKINEAAFSNLKISAPEFIDVCCPDMGECMAALERAYSAAINAVHESHGSYLSGGSVEISPTEKGD